MNTHGINERARPSLADQIRGHLQTRRATAIISAALLAVLDEHQPCEPPRQLLCNGCHRMEPCPTKVAIGAALGIKVLRIPRENP